MTSASDALVLQAHHALGDLAAGRLVDARPVEAAEELVDQLLVAHRVRRAALGELGRRAQRSAVDQLDVDQRGHLAEAALVGGRIGLERDAPDELLRRRPVDHLIGELGQAGPPLQQQDGDAELHAELGLPARSVGRWWISALGMCRFVPTRTRAHLLGPEVVGDDRSRNAPMAGCVSEPDGCGLIDTPGSANVHGAPSRPSITLGS